MCLCGLFVFFHLDLLMVLTRGKVTSVTEYISKSRTYNNMQHLELEQVGYIS